METRWKKTRWKFLKYEIRKFTIDYSKTATKIKKQQIINLEQELKNLEKNLISEEIENFIAITKISQRLLMTTFPMAYQ